MKFDDILMLIGHQYRQIDRANNPFDPRDPSNQEELTRLRDRLGPLLAEFESAQQFALLDLQWQRAEAKARDAQEERLKAAQALERGPAPSGEVVELEISIPAPVTVPEVLPASRKKTITVTGWRAGLIFAGLAAVTLYFLVAGLVLPFYIR